MRPITLITLPALPALAALACLAAPGLASAGDIYCNNQGKDCSDRPSPGATAVRSAPAPSQQAPAPAAERPAPAIDASANERLREAARVAAVQKDVATVRTGQCKAATDKYQQSIEARRMYRMTKDGEREYFTDQETDAARLSAHNEMEQACGKGG